MQDYLYVLQGMSFQTNPFTVEFRGFSVPVFGSRNGYKGGDKNVQTYE